jgi:predicted DNA-binding transcriptional regulator AlpA
MQRRLRYADLIALGIVKNRTTLANWIHERGFPPGQLTGPNVRTWGENDVQEWLASRPTAPKRDMPVPKTRPGRPRKKAAHTAEAGA